jgi:methionyl aminopeptidase
MIVIKTKTDIEKMKIACRVSANCLVVAEKMLAPGISTLAVDKAIFNYIKSEKCTPSFLHYNGFPNSACISVNEEVIHGIPSKTKILQEGDIVSVDVGAVYEGYHGDNAKTFVIGSVPPEIQRLIDITEQSFFEAFKVATVGNRIGDISNAVETYVTANGFSVLKNYCGHGVGKNLHEDPEIPTYGKAGKGPSLRPGMTLAIEPMVNAVGGDYFVLGNNWTVIPKSRSLSAHFEHTVLITENGPEILTISDM